MKQSFLEMATMALKISSIDPTLASKIVLIHHSTPKIDMAMICQVLTRRYRIKCVNCLLVVTEEIVSYLLRVFVLRLQSDFDLLIVYFIQRYSSHLAVHRQRYDCVMFATNHNIFERITTNYFFLYLSPLKARSAF
jgi:hypothetical protein